MFFDNLKRTNNAINSQYQQAPSPHIIALLGNPNVGKSTVFNHLTGLHQHTGNWPGKTVDLAKGYYTHQDKAYAMIDLPGTYSLMSHSKEEEITRNFISFEACDVCIVVCDATCLERNLNLVLQTLEITNQVVIALNLMDEAKKKEIEVDINKLENALKIPIIPMSARNEKGFENLKDAIHQIITNPISKEGNRITYHEEIEKSIHTLCKVIKLKQLNPRFVALKLLDPQTNNDMFYEQITNKTMVKKVQKDQINRLSKLKLYERFEELIVMALHAKAKTIAQSAITFHNSNYLSYDMKLDRILTSKRLGVVWMIALLSIVFWITISGANVPSAILSDMMEGFLQWCRGLCEYVQLSPTITSFLIDGVLKTCGWVIAVMLPPMAIFFPLFTLLEDFGYLPRIAFNLDGFFQKANTCGKQALTMCMGFGCNAVGVSSSRIIDSPRERLIAIITNCFMPCNGRFPTMISIITMFFAGAFLAPWNNIIASCLLMGVIIFGVILTLIMSRLLSNTLLKGMPSSFTLELPPYRKPQVTKVLIRSLLDRTLFVLGRAISVALPAGGIIWLFANIMINDQSLLQHISLFLDPFANLMGLDGVILIAFILGFPANEIVVPIMIMAYMAQNSMVDVTNLEVLKALLVENGWTSLTAICTLLFSLVHFPCATTCLTIKKETKSWWWTFVSFALPTIIGIVLCMLVNFVSKIFLL